MPFEVQLAFRYLLKGGLRGSLTLVSWIAIGGVALGVMALVVVLGVMAGLELDLKEKILGATPHIVLDREGKRPVLDYEELVQRLEAESDVAEVRPVIEVKAMARVGRYTEGVVLRGLNGRALTSSSQVGQHLVQGHLEPLQTPEIEGLPGEAPVPGVVVGEILASTLRVFVGERMQILIPGAVSTPLGRKPRVRTFQVVGILRTELFEYDSSWAFTNLESARNLAGFEDGVSALEVECRDFSLAPGLAERWKEELRLPGLRIRDWRELNSTFFSALQLEKWAMSIILFLIVLVAAFSIVSTLSMKVMEKARDIGVLKSLGASERSILLVFILEGALIGVTGTLLGAYTGLSLCFFLDKHQLISLGNDLYNVQALPFRPDPLDVALVCLASLTLSLVTTVYPSLQAARLQPIAAMREQG